MKKICKFVVGAAAVAAAVCGAAYFVKNMLGNRDDDFDEFADDEFDEYFEDEEEEEDREYVTLDIDKESKDGAEQTEAGSDAAGEVSPQ